MKKINKTKFKPLALIFVFNLLLLFLVLLFYEYLDRNVIDILGTRRPTIKDKGGLAGQSWGGGGRLANGGGKGARKGDHEQALGSFGGAHKFPRNSLAVYEFSLKSQGGPTTSKRTCRLGLRVRHGFLGLPLVPFALPRVQKYGRLVNIVG